MTLLETENLSISYRTDQGWYQAVKDVSIGFDSNKTYGIIGESGSGKTTLMMGMLNLLSPQSTQVQGKVIFQGVNIRELTHQELNRMRWEEVAVVFQNSMNTLSPVHRIIEQVVDIYQAHRPKTRRAEIQAHMQEIFNLLNLHPKVIHSYPHELSGGMMQRVSIALSLMFNPQIIILDEATTALDVITQNKILGELKALNEIYNNTKIIITHDLSVVRQTCDYVFIMHEGEIVEEGEIEQIFADPQHPYTSGMIDNFNQLIGRAGVLGE